MIKNYLKLALRSLQKNKLFTFINIFGLATGITACMLISMYIYDELSYDKHHLLAERVFQIGTTSTQEGKTDRYATTPAPLAPTMMQEFPEVAGFTRLMKAFEEDKTLFQYRDGKDVKSFYEAQGYLADSSFFEFFTYDFKEGNPKNALKEVNAIVISDEIATKIFGTEQALNKTIHINSTTNGAFDFKVTGVYRMPKKPTHINARFIMSMQSGEVGPWMRELTDFVNNNLFYSYLLVKPDVDIKKLEAKFDGFVKKYAGDDLKESGRSRAHFLTPLNNIHLHANTDGNVTDGGSLRYLFILLSIAIVTLVIACVNFMNLSTARSSKRAIEIGVRKVLGAEKSSLVRQFLWEAILLSLISFIVSVVLTGLLLPKFENISGKEFNFSADQYIWIVASFLIITLLVGLVAGMYPAFYLSAFRPVKVLKGKFTNSLGAISFRKFLVVFQFVISVALIVASLTISNQMNFLQDKDLGFQKDQQVIIPLRSSTAKNIYPVLRSELGTNPHIKSAGASRYYPGIPNTTDWLMYKQGTPSNETRPVYMNRIDDQFLQTLGVKVLAGRLFSKEFPADTNNRIILNEEALRQFNFMSPEDAIGKNIAATRDDQEVLWNIIGVVKDFHFKDLHNRIESFGFLLNHAPNYNFMIAHAKSDDIKSSLNSIAATWSKLNPNEPFEYSFLDQDFQKNYIAEERLAAIIRYFTIIAIFISCLGLFGLTTFSVEQRVKEIGIRKVLGASPKGIVVLLSKDFLKLVVISFFIASPLAWYFINKWLEGFAYRVPFTIWIIILGWSLTLLIAFLTIFTQSMKVAFMNPVKNLRTE